MEFFYEFRMPEQDVTITVTLVEDFHLISRSQGEHTSLSLLNCIHNQGTPEEVVQASAFELVRYVVGADLGYDLTHTVHAQSGETIVPEYLNDEDYGLCWRFIMPDEPVTIATEGKEKTTYAGMEFIGAYRGYEVQTPQNHLISSTSPSLIMEMKANTAFNVTSNDTHAFDFDGCYVYTLQNNSFSYIDEFCLKTYGISGSISGTDALITVTDVAKGISVPVYTYFVSKDDFGYICASDTYESKFLLEITKTGGNTHYLVNRQYHTFKPAEVRFDQGTSIASACSALVWVEGSPRMRYTLAEDGIPVFTPKGSEAGTYTSQDDSGPELVLDGFGNANLGQVQGQYTIENGVVSFTAEGNTSKYLIDKTALTYTRVGNDAAWDGAAHLYAESDYGYNKDVSSGWIKGYVHIYMDSDLSGGAKPGYATLKLFVPNEYGQQEQIINDCVAYIYEKSAGTLLLSQVTQGKGNGWGQIKRDVAFTVTGSKALVFTTDYIYSMTTPNKYIYLLGLELQQASEQ